MKYLSIDSNRSNKILDESFYLKFIDMKKLVFSLFSALLFSGLSFSQEFSGKVLDQKTKQPVPFVTIQYAKNKGVITNEEGFFVINRQEPVLILWCFHRWAMSLKKLKAQN